MLRTPFRRVDVAHERLQDLLGLAALFDVHQLPIDRLQQLAAFLQEGLGELGLHRHVHGMARDRRFCVTPGRPVSC